MTIRNGSNFPLVNGAAMPAVPGACGAVASFLQPLTAKTVTKSTVNYRIVETPTMVNFLGNLQPFTERQLLIKPEGQRAWSWYTLFTDTTLALSLDDVIVIGAVQYRVKSLKDWSAAGYFEYQVIEDWTGAGP